MLIMAQESRLALAMMLGLPKHLVSLLKVANNPKHDHSTAVPMMVKMAKNKERERGVGILTHNITVT